MLREKLPGNTVEGQAKPSQDRAAQIKWLPPPILSSFGFSSLSCVELIVIEQMNKYKARLKDINSLEFAESKAKSRLSLIRRSMVRCQRPLSRPVFSLPLKPPYLIFSCLSQPPKPLANSHAISTRTGTLSPMIAPHLCRESYESTRRWEQSVETLSLLLSDVPDQHVHRHLSLFGPDLSQALQ